MSNFYSLGAVCLGAASRILKSKFEKMAAAVVVGVVGIGLLASPFLVLADHDGAINSPQVNCIWVENHGSAGFNVDFDVSVHPDATRTLTSFRLVQVGDLFPIDDGLAPSTTLVSKASNQGWLDIPGYDGGPPLPYPGYVHSFDYIIDGEQLRLVPFAGPPGFLAPVVVSRVRVSLYVVLNSEGALESMYAWADDGEKGYEVSVYYSPGGSENFRTFED